MTTVNVTVLVFMSITTRSGKCAHVGKLKKHNRSRDIGYDWLAFKVCLKRIEIWFDAWFNRFI